MEGFAIIDMQNFRANSSRKRKLKKEYVSSKQVKHDKQIYQDRLRLAKHYEDLRLYDDSIKYYKLLKLDREVKRVNELKFNTYLPKAKEFESRGQLDDAVRLYEQLDLIDEANRIKALIGKKPENKEGITDGAGPTKSTEDEEFVELDEIEPILEDNVELDMPNMVLDNFNNNEPEDSSTNFIQKTSKISQCKNKSKTSVKPFNICPYCGEKLNLPKHPKFCPYCKEPFR